MHDLTTGEEQQWYVQSGSRVQGPFSTTEVGRYLLLGRVRNTDRVSKDGELWEPVTQVPELIPEELLDLNSDAGWNRYLDTRSRLDERESETPLPIQERRTSTGGEATLSAVRRQWLQEQNQQRQLSTRRPANILPISLLGITLVALLVVIYLNTLSGQVF